MFNRPNVKSSICVTLISLSLTASQLAPSSSTTKPHIRLHSGLKTSLLPAKLQTPIAGTAISSQPISPKSTPLLIKYIPLTSSLNRSHPLQDKHIGICHLTTPPLIFGLNLPHLWLAFPLSVTALNASESPFVPPNHSGLHPQ